MFTEEELANEEWRPVVGYEGIYEVSSLGNLRSVEREITTRRGYRQTVPCKKLTHKHSKNGIAAVDLWKDGTRNTIRVEDIVADAFLQKPSGGKRISHANGVNSDVRACNLTWVDDENGDIPDEEWRPIVGYEGLYEVSNLGRVRSNARRKCRGGIVKPVASGSGYLAVTLSKESATSRRLVHRLVAEAFLDNIENLPVVNHKDEDKTNNCASNLEWCTVSYNNTYGTKIARMIESRNLNSEEIRESMQRAAAKRDYSTAIERFGRPVLQFDLDGTFVCWWPSLGSIKRKLGFSAANIRCACTRTEGYSSGVFHGYWWCFEEDYPCAS